MVNILDKMISDEFLYAHMPQTEKIMLDKIPSENELSHKFSSRFNRKMKALLKYERRTPTMRRFVHRMKIATAMFLITLCITFGTVMSVEAYRIRFFEFVTQVWEELTSIVIHSDDNADYDTLVFASPTYIPDGYSVSEQTSDRYENTIIYSNANGEELYYSQGMTTQGEFILDSEDVETKAITIGSNDGYFIVNKGVAHLFWHDNFNIYSIIGYLGESELIKMAESIQK